MIILGLGSNIGNSHAYLERAIDMLSKSLLDNISRSNIYQSPPMLPEDAPDDWDKPFLNMAIAGDLKTNITPEDFLLELKSIESKLGRKDSPRWAPREIDIDILAWDDLEFLDNNLQIPHLGLTERAFAIIPFAELAPNWIHPRTGVSAAEYAKQFTL